MSLTLKFTRTCDHELRNPGTTSVVELFDPMLTVPQQPAERRHLFPKAHLQAHGVTESATVNQIANMALARLTGDSTNLEGPPAAYWPQYAQRTDQATLAAMQRWHALPPAWELMPFEDFLPARRRLIAQVVREGFETLRQPKTVAPAHPTVEELIAAGESDRVEFKSTARENVADGRSEHQAVRTIAAFANAAGGTLLIGVKDNGTPCGLDHDYQTLAKHNRDGFQLFLNDLVVARISKFATTLLKIDFAAVSGKDVCRIQVGPSPQPQYVRAAKDGPLEFWVRVNAATHRLDGHDANVYQKQRWPS